MSNHHPTTFDRCPVCGQSGSFFSSLKPVKPTSFTRVRDRYCSVCGFLLYEKCMTCNGTGEKIDILLPHDVKISGVCNNCGREVDFTCPGCFGVGGFYKFDHNPTCPNR